MEVTRPCPTSYPGREVRWLPDKWTSRYCTVRSFFSFGYHPFPCYPSHTSTSLGMPWKIVLRCWPVTNGLQPFLPAPGGRGSPDRCRHCHYYTYGYHRCLLRAPARRATSGHHPCPAAAPACPRDCCQGCFLQRTADCPAATNPTQLKLQLTRLWQLKPVGFF